MSNIIFRSAIKIDNASQKAIAEFAKRKGVHTLPSPILDESLLSGFILEIDGKEYDYSLVGVLNRIGKALEV